MKKSFLYSIVFLCAAVLFSCKKDASDPAPIETGVLQVKFEHVVDGEELQRNTNYTSENNETFRISTLKYYISNLVLTSVDGSLIFHPTYVLVDMSSSPSSLVTVSFANIPLGQYKGISFLLGVDSTRNVSGEQTGDLDKAYEMFWSWKSGYIFAKYEGAYVNASSADTAFMYHLGGFKKADNSLRTVNLPFVSGGAESILTVNKTGVPQIHLEVDAHKLVKNFSATPNFMGASASFADNAASMFTFEHIHN